MNTLKTLTPGYAVYALSLRSKPPWYWPEFGITISCTEGWSFASFAQDATGVVQIF